MVRITMEDGGIIDIELNEEAAPMTGSWSLAICLSDRFT